jgi:hypothetical protein
MNSKIHELLKKAGVAHGLSEDEILVMMSLGNQQLLTRAKQNIANNAKGQGLSTAKINTLLAKIDALSRTYRNAQKEAIDTVSAKKQELKTEYAKQQITETEEKIAKTRALQQKLASFIAHSK